MKTKERVEQELTMWQATRNDLPDVSTVYNDVIVRVRTRIEILEWVLGEDEC